MVWQRHQCSGGGTSRSFALYWAVGRVSEYVLVWRWQVSLFGKEACSWARIAVLDRIGVKRMQRSYKACQSPMGPLQNSLPLALQSVSTFLR